MLFLGYTFKNTSNSLLPRKYYFHDLLAVSLFVSLLTGLRNFYCLDCLDPIKVIWITEYKKYPHLLIIVCIGKIRIIYYFVVFIS